MTDLNPYATPESPLTPGTQAQAQAQADLLTEPRKVPAGRGCGWIVDGFGLFKLDPWIWIVNTLILFAIQFLIGLVPFLGGIAFLILNPIFQGGLMLGCYALDTGGRLKVEHLFAGFKTNAGSLVAVGGLCILGSIAIGIIVALLVLLLLGGLHIFGLISPGTQPNPQEAVQLADLKIYLRTISMLIVLVLIVPLLMATWFAPALVMLHPLKAVEAMKLSFRGCLRNIAPFLIYGLITMMLMVLAIIPVFLGLLVLVPTLITSTYIAYKDIFLENPRRSV